MDYPSTLEIIGAATGLVSVYFATRPHIATWHFGIISQIAYFVIFYDAQLYSDMFLQVFYTVLCIYGIKNWGAANDLPITVLPKSIKLRDSILLVSMGLGWGTVMFYLPVWLPSLFPQAAAFPYLDGFIGVMSVFATFYQAQKRVESWWLWLVTDIIAVPLYWYRELHFTAILYAIFLAMAFIGYQSWQKQLKVGAL
ncbi:MAG: hypothetical protein RI894_1307 [Bacteroidota bacterium]|jgi:nicotinamide mononucleotide transporter